MSDHLSAAAGEQGAVPQSSLEVAQAVLRSGDGSLPVLMGVGRSEPAVLLPDDARLGAAVCRAYNGLRSGRRRWQRSAVAIALRAGAGSAVGAVPRDRGFRLDGMPSTGSLLEQLADALGTGLHAGVGLGVLDAYWKPVLQLVDDAGEPVGFAKVGWTPMTRRLVENEWAMLTHLDGRLRVPVVPRPLVRLERGLLVVVVSAPLPLDSRSLGDDATAAVPEPMTALDGVSSAALAELAWWQEIRRAAVEAPVPVRASVPDAPPLPDLLAALESSCSSDRLPVGLVHGDWVPWNQARRRSTGELVVWDWEYADARAPLGVDPVHARYQTERLVHGRSDAEAFGLAHSSTDPRLAALHAALVAGRRCRAMALGARDDRTVRELHAASAALEAALSRGDGDGA